MKNSEINKIAKYVNKVFEKNNSSSGCDGGGSSNNTSYPSDLVAQDFVENKIAEEIAKVQLGYKNIYWRYSNIWNSKIKLIINMSRLMILLTHSYFNIIV